MARAKLIRVSVYVASTLAALTLLVGLLHTSLGRPLLARLGVGCPVQASPEDVERARRDSARATRGSEPSPAQPALGFVLDEMTMADAQAWAEREQVSCEEQRGGTLLMCSHVRAAALGGSGGETTDELVLAFSPKTKRLVNIATTEYSSAALLIPRPGLHACETGMLPASLLGHAPVARRSPARRDSCVLDPDSRIARVRSGPRRTSQRPPCRRDPHIGIRTTPAWGARAVRRVERGGWC